MTLKQWLKSVAEEKKITEEAIKKLFQEKIK